MLELPPEIKYRRISLNVDNVQVYYTCWIESYPDDYCTKIAMRGLYESLNVVQRKTVNSTHITLEII